MKQALAKTVSHVKCACPQSISTLSPAQIFRCRLIKCSNPDKDLQRRVIKSPLMTDILPLCLLSFHCLYLPAAIKHGLIYIPNYSYYFCHHSQSKMYSSNISITLEVKSGSRKQKLLQSSTQGQPKGYKQRTVVCKGTVRNCVK